MEEDPVVNPCIAAQGPVTGPCVMEHVVVRVMAGERAGYEWTDFVVLSGAEIRQSIDPRSTIDWVGCPVADAMWSKSAS